MTSYQDQVRELMLPLTSYRARLLEDDSYYEVEERPMAIGIATPPEMRALLVQVGFSRTYIDEIEKRLDVEGFRLAGSSDADSQLLDWWKANDMDVEAGIGHVETLVHGWSYVSVAAPDPTDPDPLRDPDAPIYRVESPLNMYADVDPVTRRVRRALRLTPRPDDQGQPRSTLLLPDETVILDRDKGAYGEWKVVQTIPHRLGVPPVVVMKNRQRAHDRRGSSEIFKELRDLTDAACRLLMNMSATAELMAVPQRLLFGVAQEALAANPDDPGAVLEAYTARIIAVDSPEAHAFQWIAAELRNFVDGLAELRTQAVVVTGLPASYYGHNTDNPASADAIRASESRLVKLAERKCTLFGSSWEQMNRLAYLVMGKDIPKEAFRLETMWRDPSTPTYAAKADAAAKLYANGQGVIPKEQARIDIGYSDEARRQMREWDQESPMTQLASLYGINGAPALADQNPAATPEAQQAAQDNRAA